MAAHAANLPALSDLRRPRSSRRRPPRALPGFGCCSRARRRVASAMSAWTAAGGGGRLAAPEGDCGAMRPDAGAVGAWREGGALWPLRP